MSDLNQQRISSIDVARGLIMVIMALDHTRDYFHADAFVFDPTNMEKTHTALFFTRWITHFCMPGFVLLSGLVANISLQRKSKAELSRYLLTRGLWFVVLELTVLRFGYFFNFYFDVTILSVLWLFGVCMLLLAALIHLPNRWILILGLIIVVGHNLLQGVSVESTSIAFAPWTIFMSRGFLPVTPDVAFVVTYPIVPWLGIMLLGYSLGTWYTNVDAATRQKLLLRTGAVCVFAFMVLRFINLYGDPAPWAAQESGWYTVLSFLNTSKYPPSFLFTLMTVGPLLMLLAWLEKVETKLTHVLNTIGRVPLFYFILHFYAIHAFALISTMLRTGKSFSEIDLHFAKSFGGITPEGGYSLGWVYLFWVVVVLLMIPLCNAYNRLKSRKAAIYRFL
ncbi:MAG TPA: heparan-alpha-glucosaminide N-acetyltransferase domain-containing protein [Cyclobacteriaceae bacterium]|nr:heparan-alpha-glucosaminide N-acetyltransferase domain-containing protein [Cyclobacteriaceae bacterium]